MITIPSSGKATPYPSAIAVAGLSGTVSKLTVTLTNFCHTWPSDVGALLVGPSGQKVVLFANVGGGYKLTNVMLTFDDAATATLPTSKQIVSGSYKPTNAGTGKVYPSPAPGAPYATALAAFNGSNPNGTWSLYVVDTVAGDSGTIKGGWSMNIVSSSGAAAHFAQLAGGTVAAPLRGSADALVIAPTPVTILETVASGPAKPFQIMFSGEIGRAYAIQATTDYSEWMTIGTVIAEHERVSYVDAEANQHSYRFYRVVSVPADPAVSR